MQLNLTFLLNTPKDQMTNAEAVLYIGLPFFFALFSVFYARYKNRNRFINWKQGRIPIDFEVNDANIAEVFIALATAIVKRGKGFTRVKEKLIIQWVEKKFPDVKHAADETFDYGFRNAIDISNIVLWCSKHLSESQKIELFHLLEKLSFVYDGMNEDEQEMILYVYGKLNIPYAQLSEETKATLNRQKEAPKSRQDTSSFKRKNCLERLGLKEPVQATEIKKTYRVLVKKIHPDRFPNATPEEKAFYNEQFQEVQEAYAYLTAIGLV